MDQGNAPAPTLASTVTSVAQGTTTYTYLATLATTTFTYDGDGLRRQTVTAAGTTNFIWDGQDVLLETDVSNNTQVTYMQTPNMYRGQGVGGSATGRRDS